LWGVVVTASRGTTPASLRAEGYLLLSQGYAKLAEAERIAAGDDREFYTSRRGEEPLEFRQRHRTWVALLPTLPGAARLHAGARWYRISRADYERSRTVQSSAAAANDAPDEAPWTPTAALASIGLRGAR
jgi:choline dehydrogenase-like flavoprotein